MCYLNHKFYLKTFCMEKKKQSDKENDSKDKQGGKEGAGLDASALKGAV